MSFKHHPNLIDSRSLSNLMASSTEVDGEWVPARPISFPCIFERFKYAFMVFCGKADVLVWFKQ